VSLRFNLGSNTLVDANFFLSFIGVGVIVVVVVVTSGASSEPNTWDTLGEPSGTTLVPA
jgi:hypothetical protein